MGIRELIVNVNSIQGALQAFKAGANAVYPVSGMSFEDLRKTKGIGLTVYDGPAFADLSGNEHQYIDPKPLEEGTQTVCPHVQSPQNVFWTTRYHQLLSEDRDESDTQVQWARDAMLVTAQDPGLPIGTVERILKGKAVIRFSKPVALRDRLQIAEESFSIDHIEDGKSFIPQNTTATIDFPITESETRPVFGTTVYCTYRHNLGPAPEDENIKPYKKPIALAVLLTDTTIDINGLKTQIVLQESTGKTNLEESIRKTFASSDRSLFTLGELKVTNSSSFESPFLPMSTLKQVRRAFYDHMDQAFQKD